MARAIIGIFLCLLAVANVATADTVTYDFTVTANSGPLAGVTESGSFSFDDLIVPADGSYHSATGLITDLSFTWNGTTYNASTANTGLMQLNSSGNFDILGFGNTCTDVGCTVTGGTDQWFVDINTSNTIAPEIFEYATPGVNDPFPDGSLTVTRRSVGVPEPSTLSLMATAFLGLGFMRRRKALQRS